ncbi:hypothetical protein Q1695_006672 [Nippostrongylus brasiliensis]|nr:hypothetical protein Q1695_006672 [Nippostrongylus brasiliensis]
MDTSQQSFILVLNLRSSMGYDLHKIIGQMPVWISDINTAAPGLIDNYLVTTYLQYRTTYYMQNKIFSTPSALFEYLDGLVISIGDTDQPTISAINSAQSFSSLMHPLSVVYVFADSAASDATVFNPKLSSDSPEMLAVQQTLAWKNKIAIFLSETDSAPIDYFGDYFDVFRRMVSATHGDLIVFEKENIIEMMDGLLPYYYRMENMAALYGVNPQDDIEVDLRADYTTQVIYVLITSDNSTVPGVLNQNGVQPPIEASGKFYKLIRTTVSDTTKIEITSKRQSNVNVRIWINSPNTAFLAAHSDPSVDVGSAVVSSGIQTYATAYVSGFSKLSAISYATFSGSGKLIASTLYGNLSRTAECSFPLIFPASAATCEPGPFTQIITIFSDSGVYYRIVPGFCAEPDYPAETPFQCFNGGTLSGGSCVCSSLFTGPNCAVPICLNGGEVEKFPGNGRPLCECPGGYGGDHCDILSCASSSPNNFDASKRSLAVIIQNTFSQAEVNSNIQSGLTALLQLMGQADAFNEYIVSTFNMPNVQSQPHETVLVSQYANSSSFLKAVTSSAIGYQNSQSVTQPSFDALLLTINSISYDKSSVFLFTDSAPNANTSRTRMTNIVEAAVERQLQINIIITPPYQMNNLCAKSVDLTDYFTLALQTSGIVLNLCQPFVENYPRDIITEFLSGYGMSHHHVESVQEAVFNNCSGVNPVQFFVDNPTSQVYAFVNSATDESFRVQLSNNDLAPDAYQLPSSVQTPFFGMYEITSAVQNTNGYTLYVSAANNTSTGWCSVRIVEKTQLAVYLGFTTDPSRDSPSQTLRYATALHPVLHVSSQLQSDVQPTLMTFNIDGSTRYKAIGVRRMPTCRYESFFEEVLTCSEPNDYFISTVLIKTNETTIQRSQRVYCFADVGACLNGGTINADNKCVCPSNFNGGKCENPICQNDGLVVNFKCQCSASFTGEFCQYVVCDNWNYLETHDVRQHEFRQITFVVERNIAMVMPSIYLQQMIASFVAASESNDIPKQYSLITFDENVVTNVVSTSNADRFLNAFNNALNNFTNSNPISTKLVDAIQEAYKISIQPPSLIYAFTSHNASKVSTSFLKQQLGIQVNVFFMQTTDFPQQPSGFYVPMIVRQSGGRLLPLTVLATRNVRQLNFIKS